MSAPFTDNPPERTEARILIVEDDLAMFELMQFILTQNQFDCVHANTLDLALTQLRSSKFFAVICDVQLGTKRSGVDLYAAACKQDLHKGIFIFITGHAIDRVKIMQDHSNSRPEPIFFFKPLSMDRIVNCLKEKLPPSKERASKPLPAPVASTASKAAKPLLASPEVKKSDDEFHATLRHDLGGKTMIAMENIKIGKILLDRLVENSDLNATGVNERLDKALVALDDVAKLLTRWLNRGTGK